MYGTSIRKKHRRLYWQAVCSSGKLHFFICTKADFYELTLHIVLYALRLLVIHWWREKVETKFDVLH